MWSIWERLGGWRRESYLLNNDQLSGHFIRISEAWSNVTDKEGENEPVVYK